MKKIFGILFALVLTVSLGLATAAPVLADVSPGWTDVDNVAAGYYHTVGRKDDGTVVAVGYNASGQCNVSGWTNITQLAGGNGHTVGRKDDGTVVAVGLNDDGQCNVSGWTDIIQVAAGAFHTVAVESTMSAVAVGRNDYGQCNVSGWMDINQVAAGGYHTVGRSGAYGMSAVGLNDDGQCNVSGWTNIAQIAAGQHHTVGREADGTVVAVGRNDYGQCNVSGWTNITQVAAGNAHTVGLKSDGTVVAVGRNDYGQCDVEEWTGIIQVAAGNAHTVGIKMDGTVVAVGNNEYGQCGHIVTETVTGGGTVDARDEADTEVGVTGNATVTVFPYEENPGGSAPTGFNALEKWVDVYVPDTTEVTEIEIRLYYTDAEVIAADVDEESLRLFWWDGGAWIQCSDSGVNTASTNGYSGYMWARIRDDTTPSLAYLQGQEWGGYGHPSETPGGGCFIATAAYGTDTAKELDVLREFRDTVLLPNSLGVKFVSFYYRIGPPIANLMSQHEVFRTAVRVGFVDPIVRILSWTHALWSARGSK